MYGGWAAKKQTSLDGASCLLKLCNLLSEDAAYSSFYSSEDYPITKVLRDPIYIQVNIMERSDPNIILNLEHCWATSNPSPHSMPQWDLVVDGYKHNLTELFKMLLVYCTEHWFSLVTGVPTRMIVTWPQRCLWMAPLDFITQHITNVLSSKCLRLWIKTAWLSRETWYSSRISQVTALLFLLD